MWVLQQPHLWTVRPLFGSWRSTLILPPASIGAFYNAGQSCCAIERVYVHESKYSEFLDAAVAEVAKLAGP